MVVTARTAAGQVAEVQYRTTPGGTPYEMQEYAYWQTADGARAGQVESVTLLANDESPTPDWTHIRCMTYNYYGNTGDTTFGSAGDLKTVTTQYQWDGTVWTDSGDTYYFRYYTGSYNGSGHSHRLERVLLPNAFAAAAASSSGDPVNHPENWTGDGQTDPIASYTCFYYTYNSSGRVADEIVYGKSNEYTFDPYVVRTGSETDANTNDWRGGRSRTCPTARPTRSTPITSAKPSSPTFSTAQTTPTLTTSMTPPDI